jgi:hypothetical protein
LFTPAPETPVRHLGYNRELGILLSNAHIVAAISATLIYLNGPPPGARSP